MLVEQVCGGVRQLPHLSLSQLHSPRATRLIDDF
jgi:hypothetical protein